MAESQLHPVIRHIRRLASLQPARERTDRQLLEEFSAHRDEAAFEVLVQRHGGLVLGVCRHVLHHHQDAEDAFQATFLVLARNAASIRNREALASWLHGVAYRTAMKAKRDAARRRKHEGQVKTMPPTSYLPNPQAGWREVQAMLDEEIQRLPEVYRAPFVLCCLEGKSRPEAAEQLGLKEGTVSSRLARARKQLQERLAQRGVALTAALGAAALTPNAGLAVVPLFLVDATVKAALFFITGKAAGNISAQAVSLAEGITKAMTMTKLNAGMTLVLGLSILTAGAGLAAYQAIPSKPSEPAPAAPAKAQAEDRPISSPGRGQEARAQHQNRTDRYGDPLPEGAIVRMGTVQLRHLGWGSERGVSMAFSADGKTLISVGVDRMVRFWDLAMGKQVRCRPFPRLGKWPENTAVYLDAILSPGGKVLAVWENDLGCLYDTNAGKELLRLPLGGPLGHRKLVLSGDGKILATMVWNGPDGYLVRLWDMPTRKERLVLKGKGSIEDITFSPDGKLLAFANEGFLGLWDTSTGKELGNVPAQVESLGFSPDGKKLASGHRGVITLFAIPGLKVQATFQHSAARRIYSLTFSPNGRILAEAGEDGLVLWDVSAHKEYRQLPDRLGKSLAFSPDNKTLACAGEIAIRLWDVTTGEELHHRPGHELRVSSLAVSPDGKVVASAAWDHPIVHLWDAATGKSLRVLKGHDSNIRSCGFSSNGQWLISGGVLDGTLRLWERATGKLQCCFVVENTTVGKRPLLDIVTFRFSPDGKRLAAISLDYRERDNYQINVWDATTGKLLTRRPFPKDFHSRFTPDAKGVTVEAGDSLTIQETATGRVMVRIPRPLGGHLQAFSPDGRLLAAGNLKRFAGGEPGGGYQVLGVSLSEVATGKEILSIEAPGVNYVDFSPDGRVLATVDTEAICVWDTITGSRLFRRPWPAGLVNRSALGGPVDSFVFMPGDRRVATGLSDGTILVWDLAPETWPATSIAKRVSPKVLDQLWADLGGDDARKAHLAIHAMAGAPIESVVFLRDHLHPAIQFDQKQFEKLVANLDSEHFAVREAAADDLAKCGEEVEPALRRVLNGKPSAEVRKRVAALLTARQVPSGPTLRSLRAVEVLERIGNPEAHEVLENLAKGAADARLTKEAKASLSWLANRH